MALPNSQPKKRKTASQFSLDMDAKGLITFLVLAILSLATTFYLGMVFGKAQRVPGEMAPQVGDKISAPQIGGGEQPVEDLSIYNLKKDNTGLEDLKNDFDKINSQVDQVQGQETQRQNSRAKLEAEQASGGLEIEPPPVEQPKKGSAKQAEAKKEKSFEPSWTDKVLNDNPQSSGPLFSVQVMATRSRDRAQALVNQLRNKGFDAYLEEVKLESATIYRIRVGREPKARITQTKDKLNRNLKGMGSELKIIQIQ